MSTWSRLITVQNRLIELMQQDGPSPEGDQPLTHQMELLVGGLLALSFVSILFLLLTLVR